ncbi:MAG: hypothetical protein ACYC61_28740 [Isosphaeraceae bacterium]
MRTYARWLRYLGLLLEMTGVVGIVRERPGREMPRLTIPGGYSMSWAWIVLAIGFVVWLVATILLAATRPEYEKPAAGEPGDEPFGLASEDEKR